MRQTKDFDRREHIDGTGPDPPRSGDRVYRATKRGLDLLIASVGLLLLSPVFLAVAIGIRISSPGATLFRQVRIGHRQRQFVLLKFRTMYDGSDDDDAEHREYVARMLDGQPVPDGGQPGVYKLANDPRVTPFGAFLRRTSLDELPQLWNVVRGEMALVGPRPPLPWEAERFKPEYRIRFDVRPGITGLWQVSGRNLLTMPEGLELDLEYLRRRNLRLDLRLLFRTLPQVFLMRGAA